MSPDLPLGILGGLLVLVTITAGATVYQRNLYASTILLGIYSLLLALTWTVMLAMDVAFTEAAVGAGISTILLFAALVRIGGREEEKPRKSLHVPALLAVLLTGGLLLYGTLDMLPIGDPDAPVHRRAGKHYMSEASHHRTHSDNQVTAVLASYRGFDTLFETAVIFTAGLGMILLLRPAKERTLPELASEPVQKSTSSGSAPTPSGRLVPSEWDESERSPARDPVLSQVSQLLAPLVIIFGIYVIMHGELGPGGGFQGGVIIASAFIVTALVFGIARARKLLPRKLSDALPAIGVLIYAGVGVVCLLKGGTYLDYDQLNSANPAKGQALGMTLVEIGVGVTVASVMVTVFCEMVEED